MAKFYQHLDALARCQLQTLQESGLSQRQIAERIGCSQSTVSRELSRNGRAGGYDCREAQARSEARRSQASSKPRKMVEERWAEVRERLWWGWSPQQVAGRLARDGIVSASATWIYRYVWADREAGGELFRLLRRRGKKANRRGRDGSGRGVIPGRVDISERPSIVEEKRRVGDWEVDTILGARHLGAIVSVVDRATKYVLLAFVPRRTAGAVGAAIVDLLMPWKALTHTITADNGKEFAGHAWIAAKLALRFYFARPYHSWERGLNEHTNGLVREYFPKSTDFRDLDPAELRRVQDLLNGRPRRSLGYRTPAEAFEEARAARKLAGD